MATGQIIELQFSLPGAPQPLKIMGEVTREEAPNRVAVEFIEPELRDREALQHFITAGTKDDDHFQLEGS